MIKYVLYVTINITFLQYNAISINKVNLNMKLKHIQPIVARDNTYFHKIFRYLAVTTFILFFCLTLIIMLLTIHKYKDELENSCIQSLDASKTASESTLESLYRYCYFLFNNNAAINDILYADSFSPRLSIEFAALKNDFLNYYSMIDSFYLINFQADMAFSNTTTYQSLSSFHDQDILLLLRNSVSPSNTYLFWPRTVENGAHSNVISLIFRTPDNNAFVINLGQSSYAALLNHESYVIRPETLVVNSYGHTINGSSDVAFASDVSDVDWYQRILSSGQSSGKLSIILQGKRYTAFYQKNTSFHFTYITILEASPFSTKNTLLYSTLLSFTIFILLGFGLSLLLSYVLYLPINNMLNLIKSNNVNTKKKHSDEISYLTDAVTDLINISHKAQKQIYLAERAHCLRHILTIADYYYTVKNDTLEKYGIDLTSEYYQVVLFSLDRSAILLSSDPSDHRLMLDSLQNIASELLPGSLYVETEDSILAYILFPNTADPNGFLEQASQTKQYMYDYFQETVTVGIGLVYDSPENLYESYTQAKLALRYRFLSGSNSILKYSDIAAHNNSSLILIQEQKEIISAVLSCKDSSALERLHAYFNCLRSLHIDSIIMNIMALNISFQDAEIQSELRFMDSLSYGNDPYNHFTLDEIFAQFSQRILSDIAQLQEIRKNLTTKPQIIDDTIGYVEANLCSADLTVENIASHIQLSTNYLRSIFKEHMGITLSKYITDKKISYACKTLVETEDSIQSICERLDFTSANYFYAYFKKNTGMTPNQYREKYHAD